MTHKLRVHTYSEEPMEIFYNPLLIYEVALICVRLILWRYMYKHRVD